MVRKLCLSSLVACLPAALLAQQSPAPSPPIPFAADSIEKGKAANPADSFAKAFGVSLDQAKERLRLQDFAAQFASDLVTTAPAGFVDLEIDHVPNFKITIY